MADKSFQDILNRKPEDAERPVARPEGSYLARIASYEFTKSSKKQTPGVEFTFRLVQALDDVDQDALNELDKWQERPIRTTFWFTPDSEYRIREFLENALQLTIGGRTYGEVMPDTKNANLIITISHEVFTDKKGEQGIRENASDFAAYEG